MTVTERAGGSRGDARERILAAAYDLFSRRGIRDVGTDEIVARSGVAKATLYRQFSSKDGLVLAFLAERERRWTRRVLKERALDRGNTPEERLLALFDILDEWFRHCEEFEACSFINVLLELGPHHPAGRASIGYLAGIREFVRDLAEQAGLRETEKFAHSCHLLMKGSIIAAVEGDTHAAQRARAMARSLIDQHRLPDRGREPGAAPRR